MFWKKKSEAVVERLPKPHALPALVQKELTEKYKMPAELAALLKAVVHRKADAEAVDIRVFDESDALARKVQVDNFTTLDAHPELVLYEGTFNETAKQVELQEKKKATWDTPLLTEAQIQQKIEGMGQPGSTVFFYMARGGVHGGPLGMGASVIELNPAYPGKKQKKYNIYTADVVDLQPVGKGQKLYDSDKPKEVAKWVKEAHHKRLY